MSKIAVVFWSGTGNTQTMAQTVADGAQAAGAEAALLSAELFDRSMVGQFDAIAFGCPAMGDEELEEDIFSPLFQSCLPILQGKPVALFGSYGWGDGAWMRNWEQACLACGAQLACPSVICREAPDEEAKAACRTLGEHLGRI